MLFEDNWSCLDFTTVAILGAAADGRKSFAFLDSVCSFCILYIFHGLVLGI